MSFRHWLTEHICSWSSSGVCIMSPCRLVSRIWCQDDSGVSSRYLGTTSIRLEQYWTHLYPYVLIPLETQLFPRLVVSQYYRRGLSCHLPVFGRAEKRWNLTFPIASIPKLCVNNETNWILQPWLVTRLREWNTEFKRAWRDLVSVILSCLKYVTATTASKDVLPLRN